jgi:hypothetical protein
LGNQSQNWQARTVPIKAILRIIKATFADNDDLDIKDMIFTFCGGNPVELLFDLQKQLLSLGIDTTCSR